ncbi:uncharacterized protein LOC141908705 [Tubulanus polymorphus]|uniref:uncharacterized protein LOC141908705 n=1 Tax=Tubulanus polymorphus TaxID=672921 RepID=UPI003DA32A26
MAAENEFQRLNRKLNRSRNEEQTLHVTRASVRQVLEHVDDLVTRQQRQQCGGDNSEINQNSRPATLPIDDEYIDGSRVQMSPNYYMLTPSDELSIDLERDDGIRLSDSEDNEVFNSKSSVLDVDGDGGNFYDNPLLCVGRNIDSPRDRFVALNRDAGKTTERKRRPNDEENSNTTNAGNCDVVGVVPAAAVADVHVETVCCVVNGKREKHDIHPRSGSNSDLKNGHSKSRLMAADRNLEKLSMTDSESRDSSYGSTEVLENGVRATSCTEPRNSATVNKPAQSRTKTRTRRKYEDVQLNLAPDVTPSVTFREAPSFYQSCDRAYETDIVPLDEILSGTFSIEDLKNAQHVATVIPSECHSFKGSFLDPHTMPVQLIQMQMTKEDYMLALAILSKDVKITWHTVFYNKWLQIGSFSLIFLTLWLMGFLLWHTGGLPDRIGIGLFFILAWFFMVAGLLLFKFARNKMNKKTELTLSAVNEILLKYNVMIGLEDKGAMTCNRLILHFVYFNPTLCLERILDDLAKGLQRNRQKPKPKFKQRKDTSPEIEIDENDLIIDKQELTDGQRQVLAKQLLHKYAGLYVKRLMTERMPRPSECRHAVNIPCLCQFIERHYFKCYDVLLVI